MMKSWTWKAVFVAGMVGFSLFARAETPTVASGDHGGSSPSVTQAGVYMAAPTNPAQDRSSKIMDYPNACGDFRPGATSAIGGNLEQTLRRLIK